VVLTESLKKHAGINLVQIPYKGQNLAFPDLISGRVHATFASASALTYVKEGKMRALAISSDRRSPLAPDVPGRTEAGLPPVSIDIFTGLFAPAGTPKDIVERLSREVRAILQRPEIREQADRVGLDARGSSPDEFAAYLKAQREVWRQAIADGGIEPN
ncbi:MAG: tripartite tricarboxylate transporter substrate binding protein, partial [Betaproteobacteria bacterium]|nr:tripartite tricarboxylate transporter substrate binding protein [Betaproteobacteria bacterium]